MSKKIAKSYLPDGGYTLTHGSNYMMDGFQFDTEYNGGPLEKARLPEAKGLSDLPSGMIPEGAPLFSDLPGVEIESAMDLEELYKESSQSLSIVDHSWLASQPKEDTSGQLKMEELMESLERGQSNSPESEALLTLSEAWGQERTDGLTILPNRSREVKPVPVKSKEVSTLPQDAVKRARRLLAYGESVETAMNELEVLDANTQMRVYSDLQAEYGLSGRVYVRESDFPGLFNGRWDEVVNKRCATSLYIIADAEDNIHERFLGRQVIANEFDIDWKHVSNQLIPKLDAYGVRLASDVDHRERIRRAFVDLMEGNVQSVDGPSTWFQIQEDPSSLISLDRARRDLANTELEQFHINTVDDVRIERLAQRLERISGELIREGFLELEQVEAIKTSSLNIEAKIERLYHVASIPKQTGSYSGLGTEVKDFKPFKSVVSLDKNHMNQAEKQLKSAMQKLSALLSEGFLSEHEVRDAVVGCKTNLDKLARAENLLYEKQAESKLSYLISQGKMSRRQASDLLKGASTLSAKMQKIGVFLSNKEIFSKSSDYHQFLQLEKRKTAQELVEIQQTSMSNMTAQAQESYKRDVLAKISQMRSAGLISDHDIDRVTKEHRGVEARLQALSRIASKESGPASAGAYNGDFVPARKEQDLEGEVRALRQSKRAKRDLHLSEIVSQGLLSQSEVDEIISTSRTAKEMTERLAISVSNKTQIRDASDHYETAHVLTHKEAKSLTASQQKVSTWVRQKMTEGSAGKELDQLLSARYASESIASHKNMIREIRKAHEGLSGHVYVDAEAYATEGMEGCDKGALTHRANTIPTVLKMARCNGCVFNTGGSCQKYSKQLIASVDEVLENPISYQRDSIRSVNASDAENTASMFANNYDPNEFNLTTSDEVDVEVESPSAEALGDVLFGGFEV